MTPEELKSKSPADLKIHEQELREELFKLKLQQGVGQLEKNHRVKQVRRDIARTLTVLNLKVKEGMKK